MKNICLTTSSQEDGKIWAEENAQSFEMEKIKGFTEQKR
jgi:hypothetical protein